MKKILIVLVLFVFIMGFANGLTKEEDDFNTGNVYYRILKQITDQTTVRISWFDRGFVAGYIRGVWVSLEDITWNSPEGMTLEQVKDIVVNYLEAHPETRHEHIFYLILEALAEKLPKAEKPRGFLNFLLFIAGRDKLK